MSKIEIHVARLLRELHGLNIYWVILSEGLVEFWYDKGMEVVKELSIGQVADCCELSAKLLLRIVQEMTKSTIALSGTKFARTVWIFFLNAVKFRKRTECEGAVAGRESCTSN